VQKAATGRARQAAGPQAPARAAEPVARGAFGQRTDAAAPPASAPQNRADRRAKKK
jgi:preprotein translocase subunit SecA